MTFGGRKFQVSSLAIISTVQCTSKYVINNDPCDHPKSTHVLTSSHISLPKRRYLPNQNRLFINQHVPHPAQTIVIHLINRTLSWHKSHGVGIRPCRRLQSSLEPWANLNLPALIDNESFFSVVVPSRRQVQPRTGDLLTSRINTQGL